MWAIDGNVMLVSWRPWIAHFFDTLFSNYNH